MLPKLVNGIWHKPYREGPVQCDAWGIVQKNKLFFVWGGNEEVGALEASGSARKIVEVKVKK